jgi:hypothetical protein
MGKFIKEIKDPFLPVIGGKDSMHQLMTDRQDDPRAVIPHTRLMPRWKFALRWQQDGIPKLPVPEP